MHKPYLEKISSTLDGNNLPLHWIIGKHKYFFDPQKEIISHKDISLALQRFSISSKKLQSILHSLKLDQHLVDKQRDILERAILYLQSEIAMFGYAVYLEAEKCGIELTASKRSAYQQKVDVSDNAVLT